MSPQQNIAEPARQRLAVKADLFDLRPDDEQRLLSESAREFALQKLRPAALNADAACCTPPDLLNAAADLGLTAIGVPESLGGVLEERAAVTAVLLAEALAEGDMGIALAALAPAGVATAIGLWGDAAQQSAYLPEFTAERPAAAAVTIAEPRAVFDPLELSTVAVQDGTDYVITGAKSMVPRAGDAELLLVAAMLSGSPALFLIERATDGLTHTPEPGMGVRAAATGRVTLDGVRVPRAALLGDGDPQVFRELIARGRIGWAALAVGTGQAVLDYVSAYVNERSAFGEPISNRQAVAFTVSNIAIELDGLRLTTYRAAALADAGADFIREAALARSLTARHGVQVGSDGVQLLGGHGYTKEHPVERWYRDLRAAGILEGALVL